LRQWGLLLVTGQTPFSRVAPYFLIKLTRTKLKTLLVTLTLLLPPADSGVHWDVNEIPTQMVITFSSGVQVSYSTKQVPCHTKALKIGFALYKTKITGQEVCYLTNTAEPSMVRSSWEPVTKKTYREGKNE